MRREPAADGTITLHGNRAIPPLKGVQGDVPQPPDTPRSPGAAARLDRGDFLRFASWN